MLKNFFWGGGGQSMCGKYTVMQEAAVCMSDNRVVMDRDEIYVWKRDI